MDPGDELEQRARARIGNVLGGKWRLDALIGVGGMASVYAATHRVGRRGAVKMLHPEISLDASARQRFLREGYVANKVGHPGSVSVLDDDTTEDGAAYLVMDLLEGETLEGRCRRLGKLGVAEVAWIADQVLDVLHAAHAQGIVHRDIKPDNLFLTRDGVVKVLDFGIARVRDESGSSKATRTGSTIGTPAYMPPEQALGKKDAVDARTDIWAVGATLFDLLTGRTVHVGETVNQLLLAAMTKPAQPIREVAPHVPATIAGVIDKALAFDQAARFQDARAMQLALRAAVAGAQPVPKPIEAASYNQTMPLGFDGASPTVASSTGPTPAPRPAPAVAVIAPGGGAEPLPAAREPVVGGATASPVSSDPTPASPAGSRGSRAVIFPVIAAAAGIAVAVVWWKVSHEGGPIATPGTTGTAVVTAPPSPPSSSPIAPSSQPVVEPAPPAASSAPSASAAPTASAAPSAKPGAPRPNPTPRPPPKKGVLDKW